MTDKAVPLTPPAELTRVGRDLDISLLTPKPGIPKIHLTDTPHSISPEIKEEGKVTVVRDYKPLRSDVSTLEILQIFYCGFGKGNTLRWGRNTLLYSQFLAPLEPTRDRYTSSKLQR